MVVRVWDIDPGYLDRKRLLGEHVEIHAIYSVLSSGAKGYSRHPETLRWKGRIKALKARHGLVGAEMRVRGYRHESPLPGAALMARWPDTFIDEPEEQLKILAGKYDGTCGRIPLPSKLHEMWAHYKYSVMARDLGLYRSVERKVASESIQAGQLATLLVSAIRKPPSPGKMANALDHMWGYVSEFHGHKGKPDGASALLDQIVKLAQAHGTGYILRSTALSDFGFWAPLIIRGAAGKP